VSPRALKPLPKRWPGARKFSRSFPTPERGQDTLHRKNCCSNGGAIQQAAGAVEGQKASNARSPPTWMELEKGSVGISDPSTVPSIDYGRQSTIKPAEHAGAPGFFQKTPTAPWPAADKRGDGSKTPPKGLGPRPASCLRCGPDAARADLHLQSTRMAGRGA